MIQDKIYTFVFHPFAKEHSPFVQAAAVLTVLALSILTAGIFLVAFGIVQLKDREITLKKEQTKASEIAQETLKIKIKAPAFEKKIEAKKISASKTPAQVKAALVKSKQAEQLRAFEAWAKKGQWGTFHSSHYDWWMFPISRSSAGQGDRYAIYKEEIEILKNDPEFMQNFLRGVELVARSWGWEVKEACLTAAPSPEQKWANWPVRLGKMADSLRLFDQEDLRASMKTYALNHTPWQGFQDWVIEALGIAEA